jgi:hypothetical protein
MQAQNETIYTYARYLQTYIRAARNRRSLESHGVVAGVPATLRRGHVYDQAPVEGLERQKRSDERTVVASHVKDVAPGNESTTSRHAERNDVVDALRALQSIGDLATRRTRDRQVGVM